MRKPEQTRGDTRAFRYAEDVGDTQSDRYYCSYNLRPFSSYVL